MNDPLIFLFTQCYLMFEPSYSENDGKKYRTNMIRVYSSHFVYRFSPNFTINNKRIDQPLFTPKSSVNLNSLKFA